jgi:Family of unknown function (DUF5309)
MSAVAGLLSSSNASQSLDNKGDLVGEYQDKILVRNSKGMNAGSTLFGLMSKLKAEPSENTEFNWFERDPVRRELTADGANAVAPLTQNQAGTIVFKETAAGGDAWQFLAEGHILRNDTTGEYVKVTVTPTTNTVSVLRAINTSDAPTLATYVIANNDVLTIITLGKDEGALPTRASYEEPDVLTNYIQTYNSVVELTNAFKANKLRSDKAGPLRARRIQALEKIAKDIESSFLLGVKSRQTGTNGFQYFTGGIADAINTAVPANFLDGLGNTGVTLDVFLAWLETFMTVGSDAKLALCGPRAYSVISSFANKAANGFRIMNQETVFGMNITVINTPFGELDLAFHPLLKEVPTYNDWIFVVDLAHVMQKTMEPLFLEPNIQTPGQDSYKEQFRAKLGLKLRFAEAFGYASDLVLITT